MLGVPSIDDIPEVPVTDVQINGSSIVNNGVANIPTATSNDFGVVKVNSNYGITITQTGALQVSTAMLNSETKEGRTALKPITPYVQHWSTFYGLAKAAGVDERYSSLPVGKYSETAKMAIMAMIGVNSAIADAISGITGFEFQIVEQLPATGEKGIIYLVPKSTGGNSSSSGGATVGSAVVGTAVVGVTINDNIYDEYIYTTDRFEKIGDTEIDLSGYLEESDIANNSAVTTMLTEVFG